MLGRFLKHGTGRNCHRDLPASRLVEYSVTDRDNLTLRARLFSGWFLKFFPASAVG